MTTIVDEVPHFRILRKKMKIQLIKFVNLKKGVYLKGGRLSII